MTVTQKVLQSLSVAVLGVALSLGLNPEAAAGGGAGEGGNAQAAAPQIRVEGGLLSGETQDGVMIFKGIPYAAPPVGMLRWSAPQPVSPWTGARDATNFASDCPQFPFPGDLAPSRVAFSEDCLYLNVWAPAGARSRRLPVMVWIHGGGFVNGGSSPAVYDGASFAKDGIVSVNFNYRLANLGFFAHPGLTSAQHRQTSGNYAFMDQLALLRWVQRNIAHFGGDPSKVTLAGESAGGISVAILLSTDLSAGLFQRAIIESGAGRPGPLGGRTLEQAEEVGIALAKRVGIEDTGSGGLRALRLVPVSDLVNGINMATMSKDTTYVGGPVLDGTIYAGAPTQEFAAGRGLRVPVLIGANSMDIGNVQASTLDELYHKFGPDEATAREIYRPGVGEQVGAVAFRAGGDQMMVEPARKIARLLSARGRRVYEYRFSYVAEAARPTMPGAFHATEIPYVFKTLPELTKSPTQADWHTADIVHRYWVSFVKTGVPTPPGEPIWPRYAARSDVLMNFTEHGAVVEPDAWKARLDLAERVNDRNEAVAPAK